jgi:L-ascorbate metabolism protein UlaG (beta-lactamase superfamily)
MGNIIESIHWLHHASFRIEAAGKTIYIDPWKIKNKIKADYILVTHEHYDHMSPGDITDIAGENTIIICPVNGTDEIERNKIIKLKPGQKYSGEYLKVEAVPAYNTNKSFHEKNTLKNGYIIEIAGSRIYHAGDTDATPEMLALKNIEVAMLPVGGTYTMNAKEAAGAVDFFNPQIAVPMHWGTIVGSRKDAEEFKRLAKCRVEILKEEEPVS